MRVKEEGSGGGEQVEGEGGRRDFKKLGHTIVELDKSKICRPGQQARDPGKN